MLAKRRLGHEMKHITSLLIVIMLAYSGFSRADSYSAAVKNFQSTPGSAEFFKQSYAYAVFPNIGKGGFGIGGAFGKGKAFRRNQEIGHSNMVQLTLGFQLGGQAYSQIIFFKDARALKEFTTGSFEFGAEAAAVALTAGASAQAGTTGVSASAGAEQNDNRSSGEWYKGMAIFTIAKGGLMYQATIGGQSFSYTSL